MRKKMSFITGLLTGIAIGLIISAIGFVLWACVRASSIENDDY